MADRPARLFLCAGCRAQVVLCSRCDHGQHYCGRACAKRARRAKQRDAGLRYQDSPKGRRNHAARQRRLRQRRRGGRRSVTHQGSLPPGCDAVLAACPHESVDPRHPAPAASGDAASTPPSPMPPSQPQPAAGVDVLAAGMTPPASCLQQLRCTRCGAAVSPWLRQGFLRRRRVAAGAHLAAWPPRPRGHGP